MGNNISIKTANYEDMQEAIKDTRSLIINTLNKENQACLITRTASMQTEVSILNEYLLKNRDIRIIVYGTNANDNSIRQKCEQLLGLGFNNIFLYMGGLFEWLLLKDIYGDELFPTTKKELDILKYKAPSMFGLRLIEN